MAHLRSVGGGVSQFEQDYARQELERLDRELREGDDEAPAGRRDSHAPPGPRRWFGLAVAAAIVLAGWMVADAVRDNQAVPVVQPTVSIEQEAPTVVTVEPPVAQSPRPERQSDMPSSPTAEPPGAVEPRVDDGGVESVQPDEPSAEPLDEPSDEPADEPSTEPESTGESESATELGRAADLEQVEPAPDVETDDAGDEVAPGVEVETHGPPTPVRDLLCYLLCPRAADG